MNYKFLLIYFTIILLAIAQLSLKKGAFYSIKQTEFYIFVGIGAIIYIATFFLQVYLLRFFPVSKLTPMLTIGSMLLIVVLGMYLFSETIGIKQSIGILLGAISIYLLS